MGNLLFLNNDALLEILPQEETFPLHPPCQDFQELICFDQVHSLSSELQQT